MLVEIPKNNAFFRKLKKLNSKDLKTIYRAFIRIHKLSYNSNKKSYVLYLVLSVITPLLLLLTAYVNAKVIDQLVTFVSSPNPATNAVITTILFYISLLIVRNVFSSTRNYLDSMMFFDTTAEILMKRNQTYMKLDAVHFDNTKTNDLIKQANEAAGKAINFFDQSVYLIGDLVTLISNIIVLILYSPIIAILIIISSAPTLIGNIWLGSVKYGIWSADAETRRKYDYTSWYLGRKDLQYEVKTFQIQGKLYTLAKRIYFSFINKQKRIEQKRIIIISLLDIVSIAILALVYLMIAADVMQKVITIGMFTFYIRRVLTTQNSVSSSYRRMSRIYENGLYVSKLFEFYDIKPNIASGNLTLKGTSIPPIIEFKNVWFKYPTSDKYVFKNFNLKIESGENIAIVGENGAGKSTLIKLLSRFYDVNKGEILYNGINIKDLKLDEIYSLTSLLSQDFGRYYYKAKQNIALKDLNVKKDKKRIIESAKYSGAHKFITKLKYGYDTPLDPKFKHGTDLSTGQWQKVALARSFYKDSPIVILDEPTSAIDPKSEFEIFNKLFTFTKDKTVIIISHRFSTVRNAERIIVIDNGKIIEDGTHEELMKINGKYKEAFEIQKKGYV